MLPNDLSPLSEERFERLWRKAERTAWRIARGCGFSLCREDRDDLLQQIRLRAWKASHSYDPAQVASFERWIARIAAHTCLDTLRERYRFRRLKVVQEPETEEGAPLMETVPSEEPSALDEILADERMRELRRSIGDMPPAIRRALTLAVEGFSPKEIAERTNTDAATVRGQLSRARSWMRANVL